MGKRRRDGERKQRSMAGTRRFKLGYYFIMTDTNRTEYNYLKGLYDALPEEVKRHINIRVVRGRTETLVDECRDAVNMTSQYTDPWVVLDKDENFDADFDAWIDKAERIGIHVGWSNPCIETWFSCYFGSMLDSPKSNRCCSRFGDLYRQRVGEDYVKAEKDIYKKLCDSGDEKRAIERAKNRIRSHIDGGIVKPSQMCPGTALHILVDEIRSKAQMNV